MTPVPEPFQWDDANVAHLALHSVQPREAEEVLENNAMYLESQMVDGEERVKELGATTRSRILVVVWTERMHKVRVITAYPAPAALKKEWIIKQRRTLI